MYSGLDILLRRKPMTECGEVFLVKRRNSLPIKTNSVAHRYLLNLCMSLSTVMSMCCSNILLVLLVYKAL